MDDVPGGPPTFACAAVLETHGDRIAVVAGAELITYRQLAGRVRAAAARLGTIRRLVVVEGANALEPLVWYLAALHAGHPVALTGGAEGQLDELVVAYDPDVVVRRTDGGWVVDERRAGSGHVLHHDLALLLPTSGSTGSSKLVRLSHDGLQANAEAIAAYLSLRPADRAITSLPMHYCYGLSVVNSHLVSGAALVLTEASVVDPCFWEAARRGGATNLAGVPHTFELLDRIGFDAMSLPALRFVTQAGGRLDPDRVRRYAALGRRDGWELFVMYGQTEATARMAYLPPELAAHRPQAIGVPIPGGSFRIEPVDDATVDGAGELVYEGPNVMLGYADGPADLSLGRTTRHLRTGDLARRGDDGLYEIVGRRSRFVKLFGLRIDLQQVEELLARDGVEAMATGDDAGLVVAVVDGHGRDVHDLVCRHLGVPRGAVAVVELEVLPRLANGKPDHVGIRRLAATVAHHPPPDGAVPSADAAGVRALFAEVLGRGHVSGDDTFVGLGGDSLSYVEASVRLEDVIGALPPGWHTTPVHRLEAMALPRRPLKRLETNVVLRAGAIVLVVATHAGLVELRGGAHVLLGIAGFNVARFQLSGLTEGGISAALLKSAVRIAAPAMLWIGLLVAVTDDYSVANIFLLNDHLGSPVFDERWRYWFIEALVQILVGVAVISAIPPVRRLARRHAFGFAIAITLAALAVRFDLVAVLQTRHHTVQPQTVLWVFTLGWAAAQAATTWQRLVVSALVVSAVPGFFFAEAGREALIAGGLLLLVWLPTVVVPRPLDRVIAPVAGGSLYIYLTHWQVFPTVLERTSPAVAAAASIVVGVAVWAVVAQCSSAVAARRAGRAAPPSLSPPAAAGASELSPPLPADAHHVDREPPLSVA